MNLKPNNNNNDYPESWIYDGIDEISGYRQFIVPIRENNKSNRKITEYTLQDIFGEDYNENEVKENNNGKYSW